MVRPALQITTEHLKEGGGYSLAKGSVMRVKLVTAQEADLLGGVAEGPAVPLFVVNQNGLVSLPAHTQIEADEPIAFRVVLDREPTSYTALPVYMES